MFFCLKVDVMVINKYYKFRKKCLIEPVEKVRWHKSLTNIERKNTFFLSKSKTELCTFACKDRWSSHTNLRCFKAISQRVKGNTRGVKKNPTSTQILGLCNFPFSSKNSSSKKIIRIFRIYSCFFGLGMKRW